MPSHVFAKGEWIGKIAADNGHASWGIVWNDSGNSRLRRNRDPNLLLEGDSIWIPPADVATTVSETASGITLRTGRKNKLVVYRKDKFRMRVVGVKAYLDIHGPIAYRLKVGPAEKTGNIENEGQEIEVPLAPTVTQGTLDLGGHLITLEIGGLGPLSEVAGIQGRIQNLGWEAGPIDNINGPRTKNGVKAFQAFHGLKVDGVVGRRTRGKMKKIYGC